MSKKTEKTEKNYWEWSVVTKTEPILNAEPNPGNWAITKNLKTDLNPENWAYSQKAEPKQRFDFQKYT